jgi:hypothetical protein
MVKQVKMGKEIVITVMNKIGVLADMSSLLGDMAVNIEAVAGYAAGNEAKIMLVTNDNTRAVDALKKKGYKNIRENEVLLVDLENKPGALKLLTTKLAQETIDIKQVYGTVCVSECPAKLILSTDNNQKALVALRK